MSIILVILLAIGGLIALLLIIALFLKKDYNVQRSVAINKPVADVFNYIKYLKNQDNFSKWGSMDPDMKKEYRGTDGEVGFVSAWESKKKNVGAGEQEIKQITEGQRLNFEIRFIKPFPALANAYMTTTGDPAGGTRVTWGFDSRMKYPMNLMLLMNMDKMVGNDFEIGLNNLKAILEK